VEGGKGVLGSRTPLRALLLAGQLPLETHATVFLGGKKPGDAEMLPVAGGDGVDHPEVDTHGDATSGT
jgi:hypothetical protein